MTKSKWKVRGVDVTIGIIGAMDEEVAILLEHMKKKREVTVAQCLFVEGILSGKKVVLLKSGIGKVNAAMATTIIHERFSPDYVINTGSAGGYSHELDVGDIVISTEVVHHDVDATAFGYNYGQVPGMPAVYQADRELIDKAVQALDQFEDVRGVKGMIATGDSFMDSPERVAFVLDTFNDVIALEMEAAAIAQVCYQYDTPFVIMRALSDIAGKASADSFETFLSKAAKNSSDLIMTMIDKS